MRDCLIVCFLLTTFMVSGLFAQDCAGTVFGNSTGRYLLMTYNTEAERDAALANINSITINGTTYNVGPHPTGSRTIRTTPARPNGTFPGSITGSVTLNPSGETCDYTASTLPIELAYMEAAVEASSVIIRWKTTQEINNEGFEVQRSSDGINFETFTWVDGMGSIDSPHEYEVRDGDYATGLSYYRFKQVDYDGAFGFSLPIKVHVQAKNAARLSANLLSQGQDLVLLDGDRGSFVIYTSAGVPVTSGMIEGQYYSLSTLDFNPGMYFLSTESGSILKFVIN